MRYEADTVALAAMVGVPAHTIRNWAARGKIRPVRTDGSRTLYDAEAVVKVAATLGYIRDLREQADRGCCHPSCKSIAWRDLQIPLCQEHAIAVWLHVHDEWQKRIPVSDAPVPDVQPVVYFIQAGELIKIGTTANLTGRLGQIATGSPERLKILLVVAGGRTEEKQAHALFAEERVRGEWFRPSERLLAFIAERADQDIRTVHGGSLPSD